MTGITMLIYQLLESLLLILSVVLAALLFVAFSMQKKCHECYSPKHFDSSKSYSHASLAIYKQICHFWTGLTICTSWHLSP